MAVATTVMLTAALAVTSVAGVAGSASADRAASGSLQRPPATTDLPTVSPAPQEISRVGGDVVVPRRVEIVTGADTDAPARQTLVDVLRAHGVTRVDVRTTASGTAPLTIHLGSADRADIAAALADTRAPDRPEAYALRVDNGDGPLGTVALGGADGAGQYYAVQSLRQLFVPTDDGGWRLAGAAISDYPAMPLRGTIEGFYGTPWTHQERMDQLAFYGDVKANTYIYAPKDDPYHREKWDEPYPADKVAALGELAQQASDHHVHFTFAVSPGNSICYSSEADFQALTAKLQQMYDLGVRAFSIPLDDINYRRWNCPEDEDAFGAPSSGAAGAAQVHLLNRVQREFLDTHAGAQPLQMVPTEYYNTVDSPYKTQLRENLDLRVVVMWTGEGVVPASVTNEQASAAAEVFGGKVFLWDNYPVNDYGATAGRLLLAPYAKREAGLSDHLAGIVSNPMNQAAASKVAVFGVADFTWNDRAYDVDRSWREAMRYLAHDDEAASEALLVFGDLNHLAPTFGPDPWQPQAPALAARIAEFWTDWEAGDRSAAIQALAAYAEAVADAPEQIRGGSVDPAFVSDAASWLDATDLWGQSFTTTLDAVDAQLSGDHARAVRLRDDAEQTADEAAAVRVQPAENTWGAAPVKIADGVLPPFLASMWDLVDRPLVADAPGTVVWDDQGTVTVPVEVSNRTAGTATDVTVSVEVEGADVQPSSRTLAELQTGERETVDFTVAWPGEVRARAAEVTTRVTYVAAGEQQEATDTTSLQVTCAASPTSPEAVTYVDSEETEGEDGRAVNAIDGDPDTFWHTNWSGASPPPPHEIQLDLGASMDVCALRYLPRQDSTNGQVGRYEVYLSQDGQTWGDPVAAGEFSIGRDEKWVPFAQTEARYVRFVALEEVNGRPWTTAAELSVDGQP
jgi:hyaluronoglucosaminidase